MSRQTAYGLILIDRVQLDRHHHIDHHVDRHLPGCFLPGDHGGERHIFGRDLESAMMMRLGLIEGRPGAKARMRPLHARELYYRRFSTINQ